MDIYENEMLNNLYKRMTEAENLADEARGRSYEAKAGGETDFSDLCGLRTEFYKMLEDVEDLKATIKKRISEILNLMKVNQADPETFEELYSLLGRADTAIGEIHDAIRRVTDKMIEAHEAVKAELSGAEVEIARLSEYAAAFYEMGGEAPAVPDEEEDEEE